MAWVKAGFTDERLRSLYYEEKGKGRDDAFIRARFGTPLSAVTQREYGLANVRQGDEPMPYQFLSDEVSMRSYHDLGDPHYVDAVGRQYYGMGQLHPNICYCRIPLSITRDENARGLVGRDRTEFPVPNEQLVLTPSKAFTKEVRGSTAPLELTVRRVIAQKVAVCQLEVSDEVPVPEGLDTVNPGATEDADEVTRDEAYQKRAQEFKRKYDALERRAAKDEEALREVGYEFPDSVYEIPNKPPGFYSRGGASSGPSKRAATTRSEYAKPARAQVARSMRTPRSKKL